MAWTSSVTGISGQQGNAVAQITFTYVGFNPATGVAGETFNRIYQGDSLTAAMIQQFAASVIASLVARDQSLATLQLGPIILPAT